MGSSYTTTTTQTQPVKMFTFKKISLKLKKLLKKQKLSKTYKDEELDNSFNESSYEEIIENLQNEAIEAKLPHIIASTTSITTSPILVTISSETSSYFYSARQTAGPQVSSI